MGLASALSTSLTGLTAAETTIDTVGNNLANSNTVGFKASEAIFATQFLQTQSLGSKPTDSNAGTNPRQIGLGTMVGAISTDFTQGTIEISTNSMNMAIQGDGFFIVQGTGGDHLYTRNGIFSLSSQNELTTITGNRVLGYGVYDDYTINATELVPLTINLGGDVVAEATENVYLEGKLPPHDNNVATNSQISESVVLGTNTYTRPDSTSSTAEEASVPEITTPPIPQAGGTLAPDTYYYRIAYVNTSTANITWADGTTSIANPSESLASGISNPASISFTPGGGNNSCDIELGTIPAGYDAIRIYRSNEEDPGDGTTPINFHYVGEEAGAGSLTFHDDGTAPVGDLLQEQTFVSGSYTYYVTFLDPAGSSLESRPSEPIAATVDENGRIVLNDLPVPDASWIQGGQYSMRVYRNEAGMTDAWYKVADLTNCDVADPPVLTDRMTDEAIVDGGETLDFTGPQISPTTRLVDIIRQTGTTISPSYERIFDIPAGTTATINFTPQKGGATLTPKSMEIDDNTTIQELLTFMRQATGILTMADDPTILGDAATGDTPGITLEGGLIKVVSNVGEQNAVTIGSTSMTLTLQGATAATAVSLPFTTTHDANGTGTMTDFIAYDSLGSPLQVRLAFELESCDGTYTTYRWYADCPNNQPTSGAEINCGTGRISFDGNGNLFSITNSTVVIQRNDVPANTVEFDLDFNKMNAFDTPEAEASVTSQDGSAPGTLTSFIVGEDGTIRGVYSNGVTRTLGQIRLARFSNPDGLEQKGENLYAAGINSGEPVQGDPGDQGIGSIVAGAVELSNTDIGASLVDLILASTMYRGNSRVITTTQEMFDELLNLQR